ATNPRTLMQPPVAPRIDRKESAAKNSSDTKRDSDPSTAPDAQPNSDWTFYAGKSSSPDDNWKPSPPEARPVSTGVKPRPSKATANSAVSAGTYTLQVAALRREGDAKGLALHLRKKGFPASVISPQGDKYYRVQVGPYADQKSADTARKGLEGAGFKAIVKH